MGLRCPLSDVVSSWRMSSTCRVSPTFHSKHSPSVLRGTESMAALVSPALYNVCPRCIFSATCPSYLPSFLRPRPCLTDSIYNCCIALPNSFLGFCNLFSSQRESVILIEAGIRIYIKTCHRWLEVQSRKPLQLMERFPTFYCSVACRRCCHSSHLFTCPVQFAFLSKAIILQKGFSSLLSFR